MFEVAKNIISPKSLPFVCHGGCSLLTADAWINDGDTYKHYGVPSTGSPMDKSYTEGFTRKEWILPSPSV